MVTEAGAHLAELVVAEPREVGEDWFERHVARRFSSGSYSMAPMTPS